MANHPPILFKGHPVRSLYFEPDPDGLVVSLTVGTGEHEQPVIVQLDAADPDDARAIAHAADAIAAVVGRAEQHTFQALSAGPSPTPSN